jgi:hypothetical protein
VEGGIVKYKLKEGLPKPEICPQNLGSTERQLKLNDLFTTYMLIITGFSTGAVLLITEVSFSRTSKYTVRQNSPLKFQIIFKFLNNRRAGKELVQVSAKKKVKRITVKSREPKNGYFNKNLTNDDYNKESDWTPPPAYGSIFNPSPFTINKYGNNERVATFRKETETKRTINGRNYYVMRNENGTTQLVPVRQASATLFSYSYNNY